MKGKKFRAITIRIQTGGVTDEIDAVHLEPGHHAVFIISNEDASNTPHKYSVAITPTVDIVNKETKAAVNPMTATAQQRVVLDPGEIDMIRLKVQPRSAFTSGGGALLHTTYKYTLKIKDETTNRQLPDIDPDFDIAPPN